MLQFNNLSLRRGARLLFEQASLQIHPGQKVGVSGANGTGKSSLFALILGELQADGGDLRYPRDWVIAHVAQETPADELAASIVAGGQRIAIANPNTAPYGAAAEAVLKAWGQWDALQGRVIRGENVAQAYQFTASGNVGFGFVALSQMLNPNQPPAGRYWRVDDTLYSPIRQQLVLLKRAADKPAAAAFWQYLKSSATRQQIVAFGYGLE